jgi:hypothetical protein
MSRLLFFQFASAGQQVWTAPSDVLIESVVVDGQSVDVTVSTDPTADPAGILSASQLWENCIAAISAGSTYPEGRVFSTPVLAGEMVFVSADNLCCVSVYYSPAVI